MNKKNSMTTKQATNYPALARDIFMISLALLSVFILVFELTHQVPASEFRFLEGIDIFVAVIFLIDFGWNFMTVKDRRYFWRHHWYELFAAIPYESTIFQALRGLAILRLLRVVKVIRVFHASGRIHHAADTWFSETLHRFFTLGLTALTLIFAGAAAFHHFEFGFNPNVHGFFDSFWWAFGTVTTVGYGDIYPVTWEGRMVAMVLILVGVGVIGVTIGTIASYFMKKSDHRAVETAEE
ncbi:MAG: ion transporter [Candidatus Kerfeldbacteria bacterium]|nr:ion transporter [Candidatus Kerfeldbacteria bacterium]